jgi:hypothetical protein
MAPAHVHVISKQDVSVHHTVAVDTALLPPLAEGAVRMRSSTLSITLTNMAYAQLGTMLGWWNAFPVPSFLPAPYGDKDAWGIVQSWGFARAIESKNAAISEGALLFGVWPTSSLPVDMAFTPKKTASFEGVFFQEVSEHRQVLMPLYNHYQVVDSNHPEELQAWESTTQPIWLAGYFLNRYGFPAAGSGDPRISPAGLGEWTKEDADLSSAVVVSLASSSKTSRGFVWNLCRRTPSGGNAPLALLEVTTSPNVLPDLKAEFGTHKTSYDDLSSQATIDWIAKFKPSRIVMVNCGAPADTVVKFIDTVLASDAVPAPQVTLVTLVSMHGLIPDKGPRMKTVHMNTSPIIETAFEAQGIDSVMETRYAAFRQWVEEKAWGDMEMHWGKGIEGADGIEGAWESLAKGALPRQKALIFKI